MPVRGRRPELARGGARPALDKPKDETKNAWSRRLNNLHRQRIRLIRTRHDEMTRQIRILLPYRRSSAHFNLPRYHRVARCPLGLAFSHRGRSADRTRVPRWVLLRLCLNFGLCIQQHGTMYI